VRERSHSEKLEPRVLRTIRWWTQESQRPAGGRGMPEVSRRPTETRLTGGD